MSGERNDDNWSYRRMASAHQEVRYDARYEVPIEIEVSGIDQSGEVFRERTFTKNVSEWGCAFALSVELTEGNIVSICAGTPNAAEITPARQSLFQIVRVTRVKGGWAVGAWKMDSSDLWGIDFKKTPVPQEGSPESHEEVADELVEGPQKDTNP
jgi:hypothetical protein